MHEIQEKEPEYYCECCHCKKIFMLLVLLILSFIAGIMVGCCNSNRYGTIPHYNQQMLPQQARSSKFQRGAQSVTQGAPVPQSGGFVFEVESAN